MPLARLWHVLVTVIPVEILVRVFTIIVSPHIISTLRAGLGVALLLEQLLGILLVLGGRSEPDLLIVATAAGSMDGDIQIFSSQPCDDIQHCLHAAAQVGRDLGADAVRPAPLLPWWQLLHL